MRYRRSRVFLTLLLLTLLDAPVTRVPAQIVPSLATPTINPAAVVAGERASFVVTIEILDLRVRKVVLERRDSEGNFRRAGRLKDRGKKGDRVSGDGFYSVQKHKRFPVGGFFVFRIAADIEADDGTRVWLFSEPFRIEVTSSGIPTAPSPSDPSTSISDPTYGDVICDEILVEFTPETLPEGAVAALGAFGEVIGRSPALGIYQVRLPACVPDAVSGAIGNVLTVPGVTSAGPNGVATLDIPPNDTFFDCCQDSVKLTRAPEVWDLYTTGNVSVKIAVVDSGVNYNHHDLGLSDSGGRVVKGGSVNVFGFRTDSDPVPDPDAPLLGADKRYHGTAVAGIIGALTNNGRLMAGMTWVNPVVAVRATTTSLAISEGIRLAVDNDAKVINVSQGGACMGGLFNSYSSAVHYAASRGRLVVASAGNNGSSCVPNAPGGVPDVLTVGAIDGNGRRAEWGGTEDPSNSSSYGPWVDIYAPGDNVVTLSFPGDDAWTGDFFGTSAAAPFVAGGAGLLWSAARSLPIIPIGSDRFRSWERLLSGWAPITCSSSIRFPRSSMASAATP